MPEPLNPEYRDAMALLMSRKVPPSLKSYILGDILGMGQFREQGRWPFSQTAAGKARYGQNYRSAVENRDLLRAGQCGAAPLDSIINRGYR